MNRAPPCLTLNITLVPCTTIFLSREDGNTGFGVRSGDAITRGRRTLRARYQLVDGRTGQVLLDATAAQDAGIDVVGSEYATIAAETTSLERLAAGIADKIVARLAVYADRGGPAAAPAAAPTP